MEKVIVLCLLCMYMKPPEGYRGFFVYFFFKYFNNSKLIINISWHLYKVSVQECLLKPWLYLLGASKSDINTENRINMVRRVTYAKTHKIVRQVQERQVE